MGDLCPVAIRLYVFDLYILFLSQDIPKSVILVNNYASGAVVPGLTSLRFIKATYNLNSKDVGSSMLRHFFYSDCVSCHNSRTLTVVFCLNSR